MKKLKKSDLPTAKRLLDAILALGAEDYYVYSSNGNYVCTGFHISDEGVLRLNFVNGGCVDWRS